MTPQSHWLQGTEGFQTRSVVLISTDSACVISEPCCFRGAQVDISKLQYLVESESTCTKEAIRNVVKEVARLEQEERYYLEDIDGNPQRWSRPQYHFTLIRYVHGGRNTVAIERREP